MRAAAADPHPPLHPRPQAQRDPDRAAGAVHAFPVPLAAGGDGRPRRPARGRGRVARRAAGAGGLRRAGRRLGAGHPAAARARATCRRISTSSAPPAASPGTGRSRRPAARSRRRLRPCADAHHAGRSARRWRTGRSASATRRSRSKACRRGRRRSSRACASTAPRSSTTSCTTPACCAAKSSRASANSSAAGA